MINTFKTTLLLSLLTVLLVIMGGAVGGKGGMILAFFMAAVMNFGSYWFSDKIILKMYNAQEITREIHPAFYGRWNGWPAGPNFPCPRYTSFPIIPPTPMEERIARLEALATRTH